MKMRPAWWIVALLLVVPLPLAACGGTTDDEATSEPAVVEQVKGTDVLRVTLTAEAAHRLDIQTAEVRSDGVGTHRTVIPYEAVLYDPDGKTWTYTSPEHLVFQRREITVARIDGDSAVLTDGPAIGRWS